MDDDLIDIQTKTVEKLNTNCLNRDKEQFVIWETWQLNPRYSDIPTTRWGLNKYHCYYTSDYDGSDEVFEICSSCDEILNSYVLAYEDVSKTGKYHSLKIRQLEEKIQTLEEETILELRKIISELEERIKELENH